MLHVIRLGVVEELQIIAQSMDFSNVRVVPLELYREQPRCQISQLTYHLHNQKKYFNNIVVVVESPDVLRGIHQ